MKKLITLAVLVALVGGGEATAQLDPYPDGLGLYYDADATEYCLLDASGLVEIYLFLTRCSQPSGISGWECHATYTIPAGDFEVGWTLPAGSLNVSSAPDFAVGLATPLPNAPIMLLATLQILVFSPAIIEFYLGPADHPSIPGYPVYAAGDDPGILIPMHLISGNPSVPVAWLNGCFTVDAEPRSFGSVKALYR
jgi:hypothetical protein